MNYEKLHKDTITKLQEMVNSEKITAEIAREICADFVPESEDEKIKEQVIYAINQLHICECTKNKLLAWLEKQGEDKEINNFIVLPGLYKCVHRMFDGTPNGKLLFEKGEIYKCLSKHDRAEFEVSYGHSVYLEDPVVYKHFIPFEKQNEQNLANEVKPKFKVGDWIVHHKNDSSTELMRVYDIRDNRYYFNDNIHFSWSVKECDEKCHLWTIQDAKDGDILVDNLPFIYKKTDSMQRSYAYCGISADYSFQIESEGELGEWTWMQDLKPATKEQRDLLFQKMKEAGYEWDVEKKKLNEIEQKPYPETLDKAVELYYYSYGNGKGGFDNLSLEKFKDIVKIFVDDYGMQKSWSEEDERIRQDIETLIQFALNNDSAIYPAANTTKEDAISWIQSIKGRIQPKQKSNWSEEDEYYLNSCITKIEIDIQNWEGHGKTMIDGDKEIISWLKSLKERVQLQP